MQFIAGVDVTFLVSPIESLCILWTKTLEAANKLKWSTILYTFLLIKFIKEVLCCDRVNVLVSERQMCNQIMSETTEHDVLFVQNSWKKRWQTRTNHDIFLNKITPEAKQLSNFNQILSILHCKYRNPSWPSDSVWQHRSRSTLARVTA